MKFGPVRTIAIDDNPTHLIAITTGLAAAGLPCIGLWYDRTSNELRPTPPETGFPYLRLVFMDLNLAEQAGVPDASALASVAMSVLKDVIAPKAGPYLLVFWTQVGTRVEEVRRLVFERFESTHDRPCPIAIVELAKGPFVVSVEEAGSLNDGLQRLLADMHTKVEELAAAVTSVIRHDARLMALSSWESRAAEAAASAANETYACARIDCSDPQLRGDVVQKVLAKIAIAGGGGPLAESDPARALDAGMLDLLIDKYGASVGNLEYVAAIKEAIGATIAGPLEFNDEHRLFSSLNTFFQVDTEILGTTVNERGVVSRAKLNKALLGFDPVQILDREFVFSENVFPESERQEIRALRRRLVDRKPLVLVELGADCDHAQGTERTRRFLVGIEVPEECMRLMRYPKDSSWRNESLQVLGPWWIDDEIKFLLVSSRRFVVSQDNEVPPNLGAKYRLRGPVVAKLLHHYAHWNSRLGIVELRPNQMRAEGGARTPKGPDTAVETRAVVPDPPADDNARNDAAPKTSDESGQG